MAKALFLNQFLACCAGNCPVTSWAKNCFSDGDSLGAAAAGASTADGSEASAADACLCSVSSSLT